MLPPIIPVFPLPNVVLFPNVFLPLHIFEPRYREMVADALAGDRLIGIALLRPGWENDYEGRPPVYAIGCAGLITHAERLDDGRFNIILRGLEKFRVTGEEVDRSYRRAHIVPMLETSPESERETVRSERQRLEALLVPIIERGGAGPFDTAQGRPFDAAQGRPFDMPHGGALPASMPDEDLVNALSQYLQLEALEKQALLERDGLLARARSLVELLEMKVMAAHQSFKTAS